LFVVVSLCALASLRAVTGPEGSGRDPATRALSIFSEVFSLTRTNYVEPTESKALLEGAYDGMSDALDPFSYYVPAASMAAYKAQLAAGAASPGVVFARRGGYPYVVAPLPGSPAEKAGVKGGDLIDSIDGQPMRNAPMWKIKAALDGPEGSSVELAVFRGGDEKKLKIPVSRARFEAPAPSAKWERDVAIIAIPTFMPDSAAAVRKLLDEASRRSIGKVILDLRGSIGGAVPDAVPVAALFLPKGPVATVVSRKAPEKPLETTADPVWKGKVVILVDDSTAGAGEVFAAALHDRNASRTVGETTVGMAIVQKNVPTEEGGSLYMTVGRYVSPSGQVLGGKGLVPDERVLVLPGEPGERDLILERGLEIVRADAAPRQAA
ncbi:MAG TPA: S41 family peptidase, partial [Thermoanaerobaculia bacterium]|nr:S41 family peptidase [Thermoanaerobaculia bacterium]